MGNSLLEITVYGRRAGRSAAAYVKGVELGERTLAHVAAWEEARREAGLTGGRPSPILLPDYTRHARQVRQDPLIPIEAKI